VGLVGKACDSLASPLGILVVFTGFCLLSRLDISIRHFSIPLILLILVIGSLAANDSPSPAGLSESATACGDRRSWMRPHIVAEGSRKGMACDRLSGLIATKYPLSRGVWRRL